MIPVWKVAVGLVHSAFLDGDFFDHDKLSFLFILTFLMNKLTNTLISTLHVWYILHPNIYVIKYYPE